MCFRALVQKADSFRQDAAIVRTWGAAVPRPYMTVLITGGTETEWVCLGEEGLEDLGTVVEDAADVGCDEE